MDIKSITSRFVGFNTINGNQILHSKYTDKKYLIYKKDRLDISLYSELLKMDKQYEEHKEYVKNGGIDKLKQLLESVIK